MKLLYKIVSSIKSSGAYADKLAQPGIRQRTIRIAQERGISTNGNGNVSDIQKKTLQADEVDIGHAVRATVAGLAGGYVLFAYVKYASSQIRESLARHAKEKQQIEAMEKELEDLNKALYKK